MRAWSNVFKIELHRIGKKNNKARINWERSSEEDRELASAGEGGETALNNAVNYSYLRVRETRWNSTEEYREVKLTKAIGRGWK